MTGWTIKGEAGAGINATERAFSDIYGDSASLTHAALESDVLMWTAACTTAAGAGTLVPSKGQLIELFHDGTRRFRGHVTIPKISNHTLQVTCEGVWWWMKKIMLTSSQTDGVGTSTARASFVFPTQDLKTSLTTLIDAAIAAGVPMVRGTIADMFVYPRITLSECSYAQALADLLTIIPDAVAWVDYSGSGNPTLHITRRGVMSAHTHAVGTDMVETLDISPRLDLEVARVEVKGVTRRDTDGKTVWVTAAAGTSTPGKNQIVLVSGPEINAFLPRDQFDSFVCQAKPVSDSAVDTFILANDPTLATIKRDFGLTLTVSPTQDYILSLFVTGIANGGWSIHLAGKSLLSKDSTTGLYVVISKDRVPEWAKEENGYTVTDATIQGWAYYVAAPSADPPANWAEIVSRATTAATGYPYDASGHGSATAGQYTRVAFFQFSVPVQLISRKTTGEFNTLKTVYRQWDYDYVTPPAGMADALLAAQNWIPWEGRITTVSQDVDGAPVLHLKHHATGTFAECSSMGALAKSVVYDIPSGRRTINLGAPARVDFGTLSDKFRRHPTDNIVML